MGGCGGFEAAFPYPRYYFNFPDKAYMVKCNWDSGKCAGDFHLYNVFDNYQELKARLKYEKPTILKCTDRNTCFDYPECELRR